MSDHNVVIIVTKIMSLLSLKIVKFRRIVCIMNDSSIKSCDISFFKSKAI